MTPPGAAPKLKLTYEDYRLFPDDGKRHELTDGESYVTLSPNLRHQAISGRLHLLIGTWIRDSRARLRGLNAAQTSGICLAIHTT